MRRGPHPDRGTGHCAGRFLRVSSKLLSHLRESPEQMRNAARLVVVLLAFALAPAAAAQEEEPYTDGTVPDTTVASGIDAVVAGLTVTLSIPGEEDCAWDFGDGNTGEGNPVDHTYAEAGTYDVTATCGENVYEQSVTVGPLATTGSDVAVFLLWGGGLLVAGGTAVWFGRREEEA